MATHDYVIDNSTGANVRADINNVLQAILSNNSSSSAPSTTAAYMWWADTTNGVLKIRNSSNNAWVELLQLDGTLTLEDGSASTPALAFRDDLDTGIFSDAANEFNVATGGVERFSCSNAAFVVNQTGADVDFRIEGSSNANLFYVDAGNNRVGIGTSTPDQKLVVSDTSSVSLIRVIANNAQEAGIDFGDTDDNDIGRIRYSNNDNLMKFFVNAGERARITSTDLLVGKTVTTTATTGSRITTEGGAHFARSSTSTNFGTAGGAGVTLCNNTATDNNFTSIGGYKSDGLVTSQINFVNVSHSSRHGAIAFMCHNGSALGQKMLINKDGKIELGASGPASRIDPTESGVLYLEADPGGNYGSSSIRFFVDNGEIMRINRGSNPFVAIGRTNQQGNEGFTVDRNGTDVCFFTQGSSGNHTTLKLLNKRATTSTTGAQIVFLDVSGNTRGSIVNDTSTTTYNTSSDYRLKENEVEISDGIDRVKQLKPYRFNWKNRPHITVDGFFAHEVENIVEDCVLGEKDGEEYQQMDHSKLVPLLVAAVKQLITKVEMLETA